MHVLDSNCYIEKVFSANFSFLSVTVYVCEHFKSFKGGVGLTFSKVFKICWITTELVVGRSRLSKFQREA